jgi:hypothetical protein
MTDPTDVLAYARKYLYNLYLLPDLVKNEPIEQFDLSKGLQRMLAGAAKRLLSEFADVDHREVAILVETYLIAHHGSQPALVHRSRELHEEKTSLQEA